MIKSDILHVILFIIILFIFFGICSFFISKIFNPLENKNGFCNPIKYNFEFNIKGELEKWVK